MNKEDAPPNQIRFAYFGDSLRIVYEVTPDVDEEIVEIRRAEVCSDLARPQSGWITISGGMDILLCRLNSSLEEAIRESQFIMTEDQEIIRDTRAHKINVNP